MKKYIIPILLCLPLAAFGINVAYPVDGGTGTYVAPTLNQFLVGNSSRTYTPQDASYVAPIVFSTTSTNYFVHSSTTIPKTYTSNIFTAHNIFSSLFATQASTTNATSTNMYVSGHLTGSGQELTLLKIGSPTYTNIQDMQNTFHSTGHISGGVITDLGGGVVSVSSGSGYIRSSDSSVAPLYFFDWTASSSIPIPADSVRYIGVEYNNGAPRVTSRSSQDWNYNTDFPLGIAIREDGETHVEGDVFGVGNHASMMIQREYATMPLDRDERAGGLLIGETGTRNITLTAGNLWDRLNEYPITALNTSVSGTFDIYYRDGAGGWTKVAAQTQWPNSQYDDGDGVLANMSGNFYSNLWFYLETDNEVIVLYGQNEFANLASAEEDAPPATVPDRITASGRLIGRFVFQNGDPTTEQIDSVFDVSFSPSAVSNHANLSNLDYASSGHTGFAGTGAVANTYTALQTFANASTTQLSVSDKSYLGTVLSGIWNGTVIGDTYITKTGDWTGTLDGIEGANIALLNANNAFTGTGTTSFNGDLWVKGDMQVDGVFFAPITLATNGPVTAPYYVATSTVTASIFPYASTTAITASGNGYFGGSVGIGNTNPGALLDVGNATTRQGYIRLQSSLTGTKEGNIYNDNTNGGLHMDTNSNLYPIQLDGSKVIMGVTGNVGIGNTAPTEKLIVDGAIRSTDQSNDFGTGGYSVFMDIIDASKIARMGTLTGGDTPSGTSGEVGFYVNSAEKMRIDAAGDVGIGTDAPGAKLTIAAGAFQTDTENIRFNRAEDAIRYNSIYSRSDATAAASNIAFRVHDANTTTSQTEVMRLLGNGYVGIGTTDPSRRLDIEGGTGVLTNAKIGQDKGLYFIQSDPYVGFNMLYDSGWKFGKGSSGHYGGALGLNPTTGDYHLFTTDSGNAGGTATLSEKLTILNGGNIGVGVAAPVEKLDLGGSLGTTGGNMILGTYNATVSRYLGIGTGSAGAFGANSGFSGIEFGSPQNTGEGYLAFHTHDAGVSSGEKMRIDKSGNIGMGTAAPDTRLDLNGGTISMGPLNGAGEIRFRTTFANNTTGAAGISALDHGGANADGLGVYGYDGITLHTGTDQPERMRITSTGLVGIGTTNPGYQFAVSNAGAAGIEMGATNGNYGEIYSYNRSSSAYIPLSLQPGGGNVGIGTTTPYFKLAVSGGGTLIAPAANEVAGEAIRLNRTDDGARYNSIYNTTSATAATSKMTFKIHDGVTGTSQVAALTATGEGRIGVSDTAPLGYIETPGSVAIPSFKGGSVEIQSYSVGNSWISDNIYNSASGSNFKYRADGYGLAAYFNGADFHIYTAPSGTAGNAATLTSRLKVGNTGTLTVSSGISAESGNDNYLCIDPSTYEITNGDANCGASSARYKENIEALKYGLKDVLKMDPKSFTYKNTGKKDIGFIAEDMVKIVPEVVTKKDGKPESIDYDKLTAVLVEAIQDQQKQIDTQAKQIKKLQEQIKWLAL